MPNFLLCTFDDLGKDRRLHNYAKALSEIEDSHIYIAGYFQSSLPQSILNIPNCSIRYIDKFPIEIPLLGIALIPISIVFYLWQLFKLFLSVPKCEIFLLTVKKLSVHIIYSKLLCLITKTCFIIDVAQYNIVGEGGSSISKFIESYFLGKANHIFLSTKSKQLILHLRGLPSVLVRDNLFTEVKENNRLENKLIIPVIDDSHNANDISYIISKCSKFEFICMFSPKNYGIVEKLPCNKILITAQNINEIIGSCAGGVVLNNNKIMDVSDDVLFLQNKGMPIFGIRFGSIGEIVKNNINGVLVEDAEDLLKSLETITQKEIMKMKRRVKETAMANKADLELRIRKILAGEVENLSLFE